MFFIFKNRKVVLDSNKELQISRNFIENLKELLGNVYKIQSTYRTFALTGDNIYINKYDASCTAAYDNLISLRKLVNRQEQILNSLSEIDSLLGKRKRIADSTILIRKNLGLIGVNNYVSLHTGEEITDNIVSKISLLEAQENHKIQYYSTKSLESGKSAAKWFMAINVFFLLFTIFVWFFIRRSFKARSRFQKEIESKNASLAKSETFLDTIIQNLPVFILVRDTQTGEILLENRSYRKLHGYKNEKIVGKTPGDFIGSIILENQAKTTLHTDKKALETRKTVEIPEYPMYTKDGKERILHLTKVPIFDESGNPQFIITIGDDITDWTKAQQELKKKHQLLLESQEIGNVGSFETDLINNTSILSDEFINIIGIKPEGQYDVDYLMKFIHPDDRERIQKALEKIAVNREILNTNYKILRPDGNVRTVWLKARPVFDDNGKPVRLTGVISDISEIIKADEEIKNKNAELIKSENFLSNIINNLPQFILVRDFPENKIVLSNKMVEQHFDFGDTSAKNKKLTDLLGRTVSNKNVELLQNAINEAVQKKEAVIIPQLDIVTKAGAQLTVRNVQVPIMNGNKTQVKFIVSISEDITGLIKVQNELEKSRQFLLEAQEIGHIGSFERDFNNDILIGSAELFKMMGSAPGENFSISLNDFFTFIHPKDRQKVIDAISNSIRYKKTFDVKHCFARPDGEIVYVWSRGKIIFDENDMPVHIIGATMDITELKKTENELRKYSEKLMRLNEDLEQVAFISAHDLLEPLRMLSNFIKLLERNVKGKLDPESLEYMNYAMENASRMNRMINDLQIYTSIDIKSENFIKVDFNKILKEVLQNLDKQIKENSAEIIITNQLPVISAKPEQILMLFECILDNALKFKNNKVPKLEIASEELETYWQFSIRDNGIGLDQKYADRIFMIFKRLHARDKYPGSGIGLAVAKKIVLHHGGNIWYETKEGEGTTFFFTIKKPEL